MSVDVAFAGQELSSVVDRVAHASALSYRQAGDHVILQRDHPKDSCTLVLPRLRRLEEVRATPRFTRADLARFRRLHERFEVWVLLPIEKVGEGHGRLRGVVDRLQPWWIENGMVRFGTPRIP